MLNVSSEPAARPLPEQQDEHNYEDEQTGITTEAPPLELVGDEFLEEIFETMPGSGEIADSNFMDVDMDVTSPLNFYSEGVEMGDAPVTFDEDQTPEDKSQGGKSVAMADGQSDGSKDSKVRKENQNPSNTSTPGMKVKGKFMGVVIPARPNQAADGQTVVTVPLKGVETVKSVEVLKVGDNVVEGSAGNGKVQTSESPKSVRCFEEESSPEPDVTDPSEAVATDSETTTPFASTPTGASAAKVTRIEDDDALDVAQSDAEVGPQADQNESRYPSCQKNQQSVVVNVNEGTEPCHQTSTNQGSESGSRAHSTAKPSYQELNGHARKDSVHTNVDQDGGRGAFNHPGSTANVQKAITCGKSRPSTEVDDDHDDDHLYGEPQPPSPQGLRKGCDKIQASEITGGEGSTTSREGMKLYGERLDDLDGREGFSYLRVLNSPHVTSLSLEKLIVLALANTRDRSLSLTGIINQINGMSEFHEEQGTASDSSVQSWTMKVEDILHQYDFPTQPQLCPFNNNELAFALPSGGEWFVLNKPRKSTGKAFRLQKLPFEVRLKIYTFVLHLPLPKRCGWTVDKNYTLDPNRHGLFNCPGHLPQHLTTKGPDNWQLRSRPIPELLALTMTSKAVQKESLPVFYRTNTFYFPQPLVMGRFLSGIPNRLAWIRNIILNFDPPTRNHQAKRSIGWLFNTKLRHLHLVVNEQDLLIKHCVHDITDLPGVRFLGELSGLDRVTFQGESRMLKHFLAKAQVTSVKKGRNASAKSEWDTDEEVETQEGRRAKLRLVEMRKAFKNKARDAASKESRMRKEVERKAKAQRAEEAAERKKIKNEAQAVERKRKREEKERRRAEREGMLEEERERKEEIRKARKANSKRRAKAREDEKVARRQEREATRAEKKAEVERTKKEKQRAAKNKIAEMTKRVQQSLGQASDDDDNDGDSDTSDDGDSDIRPSRAHQMKPKMGWFEAAHPSSSSSNRGSDDSSDDEAPEPPKKKARTTQSIVSKGKSEVQAQAQASKPIAGRSSGQPPRKEVPAAARLAAVRKTMQKGNSGAQAVKTSTPPGPSRATAAKAPPKDANKKKVEMIVVSDDESSDEDDLNEDFD